MVVLSKVVVVEFDEAVDGLLDRAHLDQGHFVVLPVRDRTMHFSGVSLCLSPFPTTIKEGTVDSDLLKELEGLDGGS